MKRLVMGACFAVLILIVVALGAVTCGGSGSDATGSSTASSVEGSNATSVPSGEGKSFSESLESLSDHGHWAVVDRTGQKPTYNYGFN